MTDHPSPNEKTRDAWDHNADFWDSGMGEGNDWLNLLVWPGTAELLNLKQGDRVLDVACGNGVGARRLAADGANVVAFDFSLKLIEAAQQYATPAPGNIEYHVIDATDFDAMVSLGKQTFDAAVCSTALFDIADIGPLMQAVKSLLKPGGCFVFSLLHPCFNNPSTIHVGELEDKETETVTTYSMKISRYMTPFTEPGLAMPNQPVPHLYFHRSLSELLGEGFRAGFVLDALQEKAFEPDYNNGSFSLSWNGLFSEIPPIMIVRMR